MSTLMRSKSASQTSPVSVTTYADRVSQIAESRLRNSSYWSVRYICCEYHDGVLILRGRVSAYYLKQVAQAVVAEMDGLLEIDNRIEVM